MKLFLTSSPSGALDVPNYDKLLDESNGFVDMLKKHWKEKMKGLIICADPYNYNGNDEMGDFFTQAFDHSGVKVISFDLWDYRVTHYSKELLQSYDVIMIGGGHVPTQNQYFKNIGLKDMIADYKGIIIGVSAGTMNCANIVYAFPEEAGESIDPNYQRFINGLGLTDLNILPHYQMVKDYYLDGVRLYEDIAYIDSYGHPFLVLEDGSYVYIYNNESYVYGKAYILYNGVLEDYCENGQMRLIEK